MAFAASTSCAGGARPNADGTCPNPDMVSSSSDDYSSDDDDDSSDDEDDGTYPSGGSTLTRSGGNPNAHSEGGVVNVPHVRSISIWMGLPMPYMKRNHSTKRWHGVNILANPTHV